MAAPKPYKHDLKYDFLALPKGQLIADAFPELLAYREIQEHGTGENNAWLGYCILLTDKGSGLLKLADIELRHREALRLAGIPATDRRANAAVAFTDEALGDMCFALLRDSEAMMLSYVLAGEIMLWQDMRKMRTSPESVREESVAPKDETDVERKKRENRDGWAAANETAEKVQKAYTMRGDFFDKIPLRIIALNEYRKELFLGDKPLEKQVAEAARRNEGIVEQMAREARDK